MTRLTKSQIADNAAAQLHAEQQAALRTMRAEKAARTRASNKQAKAAAHAETVQPEVVHASIDELMADIELPSAKRVLVGVILAIAASFATGYAIGMLLSYAIAGILTLTATAWVAFTLTVLAWIIAIYATWKVTGIVAGRVFASVVMPEGLASRSYESVANASGEAKSKMLGWFSSAKEVVVAPFSGAHPAAA
jgi:hypothetical protein